MKSESDQNLLRLPLFVLPTLLLQFIIPAVAKSDSPMWDKKEFFFFFLLLWSIEGHQLFLESGDWSCMSWIQNPTACCKVRGHRDAFRAHLFWNFLLLWMFTWKWKYTETRECKKQRNSLFLVNNVNFSPLYNTGICSWHSLKRTVRPKKTEVTFVFVLSGGNNCKFFFLLSLLFPKKASEKHSTKK